MNKLFSITIIITTLAISGIAFASWVVDDSLSTTDKVTIGAQAVADQATKDGLVGHWTFNGGDMTATVAFDKSGNGNIATKGSSNIGSPGKIGQGTAITGTTGNVFDFGEPAELVTDLEEMTVSLWVKMDETESQNIFLSWSMGNAHGSGQQEIYLDVDTRTGQHLVRYAVTINGVFCAGTTAANTFPTDQRWHHVVIVKSATITEPAGYPVFYIDNKNYAISEDCTSSWFAPGNASLGTLDENKIGALTRSAGNIVIMNGSIDDLRIYNRQLSVAEIQTLYQTGGGVTRISSQAVADQGGTSGLLLHWTFNGADMSSTNALDVTGNGNTGTLVNNPKKVAGKIGQGMAFVSASDQKITNSSLSTSLNGDLTVMTWVRFGTNAVSTAHFIDLATATDTGIQLIANTSNSGWISIDNSGGPDDGFNAQNDYRDDKWHHVVTTRVASTKTYSLYIDGILMWSDPSLIANPTYTRLIVGDHATTGTNLTGQMDDVRVYNRALSADEIYSLYQYGK